METKQTAKCITSICFDVPESHSVQGPLHMSLVTGLAQLLGQILFSVHIGNFSLVDQVNFKTQNQNGGTQTCIVLSYCSFLDLCSKGNIFSSDLTWKCIIRQKFCHFWHYVVIAKLFRKKSFILVTWPGR